MSALELTMHDDTNTATPRRSFLGRLATGAAALGLTAFVPATACAAEKTAAMASDSTSAEPNQWPGTIKTKHKMLIDAFALNEGFPLAFAYTFMLPYATDAGAPTATALIVARHAGFPLAVNDAVWAKYHLGKAFNIIDPATKQPAERNVWMNAKPGTLAIDDMAIDKLMSHGVIFGACNVALHMLSTKMAPMASVTPEVALADWTAGIIPGMTIIPSGTWGVNRGQELGCSYLAGA